MKLIEQVTLYFKQGNSDKVYEVDLCEVSAGAFVVNFRFGRRDGALKDGSKTVVPVDETKARRLFNELIKEKEDKGYRRSLAEAVAAPVASSSPAAPAKPAATLDLSFRGGNLQQAQAIVARLQRPAKAKWRLSRAIWRAGEMQLLAAADLMLPLIGKDPFLNYSIAWALGRCGEERHLPALQTLMQSGPDKNFDTRSTRRAALSSSLLISQGEAREACRQEILKELPQPLSQALAAQDLTAFARGMESVLAEQPDPLLVENLYLLDEPLIRDWLLAFTAACPLRPGSFHLIRHLYKLAEQRGDAAVFGLIAHRLETTPAYYRSPSSTWNGGFHLSHPELGSRFVKNAELKKDPPPLAYGSKTRDYLRRRSWHTLERLGQLRHPDFVRFAAATLVQLKDDDGIKPYCTSKYEWTGRGQGRNVETWWDRYARFISVNFLLYGNSPRYELGDKSKSYRCRGGFVPGSSPVPAQREESFPELWDAAPGALVELLKRSRAAVVHEFAVKPLRELKPFWSQISDEDLESILAAPYPVTGRFALELALPRLEEGFRPRLIAGLLHSPLAELQAAAAQAMQRYAAESSGSVDLLLALICAPADATRSLARHFFLRQQAQPGIREELVRRVATRLAAESEEIRRQDLRRHAVELLRPSFPQLPLGLVLDFLSHPCLEVQELAAAILVEQDLKPEQIPPWLLQALLNAGTAALRDSGVRLLGRYRDAELLAREELLLALASSPHDDLRPLIGALLLRVCDHSPDAARRCCEALAALLIRGRLKAEVLEDLLQLLSGPLLPHLRQCPPELALKLLSVKVNAANLVGARLIDRLPPEGLDALALRRLLVNENALVRDEARKYFSAHSGRYLGDLLSFVPCLDTTWRDSRDFLFKIFHECPDLSAEVLIAICDCADAEVQAFGRQMLIRRFQEGDQLQYLLQLSEHPSPNVQLFTSGFVEQAAGKPAELRRLLPYFASSLARVNSARIVKKRLLPFLEKQALLSEENAGILLPLFRDHSASCAVEMKAACLQVLVKLRQRWPLLDSPVRILSPGAVHGV
ncbi:MAG: hypothetical protein RL095_2052 [Verrucomicrobiota bacterium]